MTEAIKFQSSTMLENYIRLLGYIDSQMDTDEIDYAERDADRMQTYIKYYLEHIDSDYMYQLRWIIPLEILKEKILDVPFGFGNKDCNWDDCYFGREECRKEQELYNTIKEKLHYEIHYYENICKCASIDTTKFYQCWHCMVRDCGCKADRTCCGRD